MGGKHKYKTGDRFQNSIGKWCTIIDYKNSTRKNRIRANYLVKFDSGYEIWIQYNNLIRGSVKDRLSASLHNVGCIGIDKVKNWKLYSVWNNMICRCYDHSGPYYKHGVKVCKRWHNFSNFQKDVIKLEGYNPKNLKKNGNKGLELDKDIIGTGKLYSPYHCMWVTQRENTDGLLY